MEKKMSVLIVDDSRTSRRILRDILESGGYHVIAEAENGEIGVERYQALRPDIVTLDITMPVMDGIEVLKAIKAFDPDATVVMLSAAGQASKVLECFKSGAAEFIGKPFEASKILELLEKVVKHFKQD